MRYTVRHDCLRHIILATGNAAGNLDLCPSQTVIHECIDTYEEVAPGILQDCALRDDIPGAVCLADNAQIYGIVLVLVADSLLSATNVCWRELRSLSNSATTITSDLAGCDTFIQLTDKKNEHVACVEELIDIVFDRNRKFLDALAHSSACKMAELQQKAAVDASECPPQKLLDECFHDLLPVLKKNK